MGDDLSGLLSLRRASDQQHEDGKSDERAEQRNRKRNTRTQELPHRADRSRFSSLLAQTMI